MDINPTMTITSVLNGHTAIFIFVQTYDIFDSNVLNSYPNILKNVMTNSAGSNPSPERIKINNDQHFNSQSLLNQQLDLFVIVPSKNLQMQNMLTCAAVFTDRILPYAFVLITLTTATKKSLSGCNAFYYFFSLYYSVL